ncbi:MAG: hypothetical protein KJN70_01870, partial [Eudoraea sp.]|nr:hypothetical protein [Eudoraea sp.]
MNTSGLKRITGLILLLSIAISCISEKENTKEETSNEKTLFTLLPSEQTGIDFLNKVENQKNFNIFKYRNFYNGGGVAIGD